MYRALVLAILLLVTAARAEASEPVILKVAASPNGVHGYYHALLLDALAIAGIKATLAVQNDMPQPRLEMALREGTVDVHFFLRTPARDRDFIPIPVGLTDGLVANRILLIRRDDLEEFSNVRTLDDFRRKGLVAGFGQQWFDVTVWRNNRLECIEFGGDYQRIFTMVARGNRDVDYFPRGLTEILSEVENRPGLTVEPHLLFRYQNDHVFYLSRNLSDLAPRLIEALQTMAEQGAIRTRAHAYWAARMEALKLDQRVVIDLAVPEQTVPGQ